MMNKLKKTAVLLGGVMLILLIIVWGIKHNMKPVDVLILKRMGQKWYEENIGTRDDFRRDFIKSYL